MTTLEIICLYGLGISLCLLLFDAAGKTLRAAWRRNGRRYGVAASLIGLAVVCTINAQKPGPTPVITVDSFLADAGSYATNDVLHVAVTNAPAYAGIDFSSCPVLVYARPRGLSDAPGWEELLPRRTFSELPADYAIEDATNYNYLVYLDYVPPSPVHTNGVFELRGFVVPGDEPGNLEQLAAGFINSRAILPPPTARDYVQDGLIAMWDGIENAGWGIHDPNATTWKDLVGSGNLSIVSANSDAWANDAFLVRSANNIASAMYGGISSDTVTFEIVWDVVSVSGNNWNVICMNLFSDDSSAFQIGWTTSSGYSRYYGGSSYYPLTKFRIERFPTSGFLSISHVFSKSKATTVFTNGANANATRITSQFAQYPHYIRLPDSRYASGFNASIHSVRLYSRALTPEEIQHNYEIDKERFNLP